MNESEEEILADVEGAARWTGQAADNLLRAIQNAHAQGLSLRRIAEAAGMSHESVRRMIRTDQT